MHVLDCTISCLGRKFSQLIMSSSIADVSFIEKHHKFSAETIDFLCKLKVWFSPATSIFSVLYEICVSDNDMLMQSFHTLLILSFNVWLNG